MTRLRTGVLKGARSGRMDAAILGYSTLVGVSRSTTVSSVRPDRQRAEKTGVVISKEVNVNAMSATAGA